MLTQIKISALPGLWIRQTGLASEFVARGLTLSRVTCRVVRFCRISMRRGQDHETQADPFMPLPSPALSCDAMRLRFYHAYLAHPTISERASPAARHALVANRTQNPKPHKSPQLRGRLLEGIFWQCFGCEHLRLLASPVFVQVYCPCAQLWQEHLCLRSSE